jgi:hypothetical protein
MKQATALLVATRPSNVRARRHHHPASVSPLAGVVRELRTDRRIRIRPDVLTVNVIDIVGAIARVPLLLILRRGGLRSRRTIPMRRAIPRLSESGSCNHSHKRHGREQFLHCIVSWFDLAVAAREIELSLWNNFSIHEMLIR